MRSIIQRVKAASVKVGPQTVGQIGAGVLVFLAIAYTDSESDLDWMVEKIAQLRIFADQEGKMNLAAKDAGAEFLVVSQFTLLGDCSKGRRPSFDKAADPKKGEEFYLSFIAKLKNMNFKVESGIFRADMQVALVNDGPVTFVIEK